MNRFIPRLFMVVLCGSCIGCGSDLVKLQGEITYNGTPISEGQIQFFPSSGKGPTAGAIISGGHYSLKIKPGEKTVKILGYKVIGNSRNTNLLATKGKRQMPTEIKEQYLPTRFNEQTELTCKVGTGAQTQDFTLTVP